MSDPVVLIILFLLNDDTPAKTFQFGFKSMALCEEVREKINESWQRNGLEKRRHGFCRER